MKRVFSVTLALLLFLSCGVSFISCKKEPEVSDTLTIVNDGKTDYRIVYATSSGLIANRTRAEEFAANLKNLTGATFSVVSDSTEPDAAGREIVIGATKREDSQKALAALGEREETFLVRAEGNRIIIAATGKNALEKALSSFTEETVAKWGGTAERGLLTLPKTLNVYEYITAVLDVSHIGYASAVGSHTVLQGGCTDGTYGYFCLEDQKSNYNNSAIHTTVIVKIDLATGKCLQQSAPMYLDHSNDMCYADGKLVVVHNGQNKKKLTFISPKTLEKVGEHTLEENIFSIAYNELHQSYVVGISGGQDFRILNKNFVRQTFYRAETTDCVTQGVDCDDDFIYFVQTGSGKNIEDKNFGYIIVYDWDGNFVGNLRVPLPTEENREIETECIFHIGNTFYIGYNGGGNHIHSMRIVGLSQANP